MGTTTSKNLGQVSSIKTGTTPPSNRNLLWLDTNTNPPTKKSFDIGMQTWLEVVFLPSPANVIKKMIISSPDTNNPDTYVLLNEDVFIKTADGATYVNLPIPTADYNGKVFEIVNHHPIDPIYFNFPIRANNTDDIEQLAGNTSLRIVCSLTEGQFKWVLLSKNNLL
jgi:hypothetical protein